MKTLIGKVVSDKMKGTVSVEIVRLVAHPLYGKRMRKNRKLHAENSLNVKVGETVKITETRPVSRTKNWRVIEVIKQK